MMPFVGASGRNCTLRYFDGSPELARAKSRPIWRVSQLSDHGYAIDFFRRTK